MLAKEEPQQPRAHHQTPRHQTLEEEEAGALYDHKQRPVGVNSVAFISCNQPEAKTRTFEDVDKSDDED